MYNVEKYVGECLDSILAQTFQDFEVLVVDDCSTDNSCAVVESYFEKFDGRLKLYHTEKNSGGGGYVPRNVGLNFSRGEYIFFVDADDFIAENALEILYTAAKKYDADVVYTSTRYFFDEVKNEIRLQRDAFGRELIESSIEDKITLTVNNPDKNLQHLILESGFAHTPWTKFVQREFLINNKIAFPEIITYGDSLWTIKVLYYTKRFLRIPNTLYYYRKNHKSVTLNKLPAREQVVHCVLAFLLFAKALKDFFAGIELFEQNPNYFQAAAINAFRNCLNRSFEERNELSSEEIYEVLYHELSKSRDLFESMIPFFFSFIDAEKKAHENNILEFRKSQEKDLQEYRNVINGLTARMDIQLMSTAGDFHILSVSDEKAELKRATWLRNEIGYMILSCVGKLEFVVKATSDGKIRLILRGMDVRSIEDKSKRIPCWIDFAKLIVNGKIIFDELTPAWHDKPYRYDFNVRANEEIKIQVLWFPHSNISEKFPSAALLSSASVNPAIISVIIPMYNAEQYIAECLESVLNQTFQNFEVIVVDDCSTDNSCAVVESYLTKFSGRLRLCHTEENSGGGGYVPRNKGFSFARGEYVFFLDSDDFILLTALETLYNAAKEHDADVVYTSLFYRLNQPNDVSLHRDGLSTKLLEENQKDNIELTIDAPDENLRRLLFEKKEGNFRSPWTKFIRRDFLIENKILFPTQIMAGGDFVWVLNVYCHAKRFLRLPTPLYFQRRYNENSVTRTVKSPPEQISFWFLAFVDFAKNLRELEKRNEILAKNPAYCLMMFKKHFEWCLNRTFEARKKFGDEEIYKILHSEFTKDASDSTVLLLSFLFSFIETQNKFHEDNLQEYINILSNFTARIDIKLMSTAGDFQIVSVSDEEAKVEKPKWFNKDGIGYLIQSYAGKLEIVIKTSVGGKIQLGLRGLDVRNPENRTKRIPVWIDYTKFVVNGKTIFDKIIPVWHDKPYFYNLDAKAGEEIKFQVEWLPHRADNVDTVSADVAKIQKDNAEKLRKSEALISELRTALSNEKKVADKQKGLVSELQSALDNEKKVHKNDVQLIGKFKEYFTARADIQLATKEKGEFQIISISDDAASIAQPKWFQKNGVGYQIQSYAGKLDVTVKGSVDGQIKLRLRGLDVRTPEDKTKRIPYWINYKKLIVGDEIIFDEITPACLEKFYSYNLDVKAGEEIKIQIEWLHPQK